MRPFSQRSFIVLCCISLSGCFLSAEKYQRPAMNLPAGWQGGAGNQAAWPETTWWKGFQTAELDHLIDDAQNNSHDLKAAAARVAQARANVRIIGAPLYPTVAVGAGAAHIKNTSAAVTGLSTTTNFNSYSVLPQVIYGLDIWGVTSFAKEAASDALLASTYAQEVVRLTLVADVATTYFQILSLDDLLDDAHRNLDVARKTLGLVTELQRSGRMSKFDVERQASQVSTTEASIPPLVQQLRAAQHNLAVLSGKNPDEITIITSSLRTLPLPQVPLGMPSQLLERRPDVRQAEMNLLAANANIGAARAALFPTFTLNGLVGATRNVFAGGLVATNYTQSIGLNMLATIFDGGRRLGGIDLAKAQKLELVEIYQQTVISSLRDVEDALAGIEQFSLEEDAQRQAVTHAREVYRLADLLLHSGAADFTAVLDAERTLVSAETSADQARFNRFFSAVALYRALGGGWGGQQQPPQPAGAVSQPDGAASQPAGAVSQSVNSSSPPAEAASPAADPSNHPATPAEK